MHSQFNKEKFFSCSLPSLTSNGNNAIKTGVSIKSTANPTGWCVFINEKMAVV